MSECKGTYKVPKMIKQYELAELFYMYNGVMGNLDEEGNLDVTFDSETSKMIFEMDNPGISSDTKVYNRKGLE